MSCFCHVFCHVLFHVFLFFYVMLYIMLWVILCQFNYVLAVYLYCDQFVRLDSLYNVGFGL